LAWLQGIPDQEIRLSAATLGELQNGVEITRRQNREKAIQIEKWIDQVAATYQVLPIDGDVFREWGRLIKQPDQLIDSLLAATVTGRNSSPRSEQFSRIDPRHAGGDREAVPGSSVPNSAGSGRRCVIPSLFVTFSDV
jgi:hypothetical protein